jgi:hypothetical protein
LASSVSGMESRAPSGPISHAQNTSERNVTTTDKLVGAHGDDQPDKPRCQDRVAERIRERVAAIAAGGKVRVLYLLGPRMRKYEADAFGEEVRFVAHHPSAYERVAVVTDEEWLRPALRLLSMLVPGQIRAFPVAALDDSKSWIAGGLDERGTPVEAPAE